MKDRLKSILLIAGITAMMIVFCQLYWVYYNYRTAKTNFSASANLALKHSIDQYWLSQIHLPASLQYKRPTLTFMTRTIPSQDPIALDTPESKRRFSAEFATVAVDEIHLQELKAIVARLTSQQLHRPINLDTLSRLFHRELMRDHINERFSLSSEHGSKQVDEGDVAAKLNFYKDPILIKATLTDPGLFFLRHNFGPVLISSVLILIAAGSLFYMGRIIQRQAQLDSMKTDFINNVSHELKTPLSILKTSNEALANFGAADDPASLKRYLTINAQVINDLEMNIDRMMDLPDDKEQLRVPLFEAISLQELVYPLVSRFSVNSKSIIELVLSEEPFLVRTDKMILTTIISNLIDNAIKFSGAEANIKISGCRSGRRWILEVNDDGPGIGTAHLPYIFDKFYRVPTGDLYAAKGYGIGLALVKDLVSALDGAISVISKLGFGTTFKISFNN